MGADSVTAGRSRGDLAVTSAPAVQVRGIGLALLATICWSSSGLLVDRLSTGYRLTSLELSTWRMMLVLPILAVIVVWRRQGSFVLTGHDLVLFLAAGAIIMVSNMTWALSVELNRPAAAAALGFSAPAMIALSERFLFGARLGSIQSAAVAVNLVGCALASGVTSLVEVFHSPAGLLIGLANGAGFSAYTLLSRHVSPERRRDPFLILLATFTFSAMGMVLWGAPVERGALFTLHLSGLGWTLLIALGVFPTLASYAFYNASLRRLPATVASLITTLEPPLVAVFALLLLARAVTVRQWIGIGLIVTAVLVMQLTASGLLERWLWRFTPSKQDAPGT